MLVCCQFRKHDIHTQKKDDRVQFAVTLTPATTNVEKKNSDTRGGASQRIRGDISIPIERPKVRVVGGSWQNVAWHSNALF